MIHFCDNQGACAAIVKGYSAEIDGAKIVNAWHAFNSYLRADVFFEFVRSAANPADLPSRMGMGELWALLEDAGAERIEWEDCVLPKVDAWERPIEAWMRESSRAAGARSSNKHKRKRGDDARASP